MTATSDKPLWTSPLSNCRSVRFVFAAIKDSDAGARMPRKCFCFPVNQSQLADSRTFVNLRADLATGKRDAERDVGVDLEVT